MSPGRMQDYDAIAQKILKYLKAPVRYDHTFLPRPFFLEFTGTPSAGKTTIIKELDKFLRRQGFKVLCPQEGAEEVRHIPRSTPLYNLRTGIYALTKLIDESSGHRYDIVIFDRCIFDAYCWMMYWTEKGALAQHECKTHQDFFLSHFWEDKIDLAYFVLCEATIAVAREQRIALSDKLGETTNPKTIEALAARYRKAYEVLSPTYTQLRLLDTTHLSEQEMVEKVASEVLSVLDKKVHSKPIIDP
jgi:thymidylate kinase